MRNADAVLQLDLQFRFTHVSAICQHFLFPVMLALEVPWWFQSLILDEKFDCFQVLRCLCFVTPFFQLKIIGTIILSWFLNFGSKKNNNKNQL